MDDTHEYFNSNWKSEGGHIIDLTNRIEDGLRFLIGCFEDPRRVGRRWVGHRFETPVNRAVLDVQLGSVLDQNVRTAVENGALDFKAAFVTMSEQNVEFRQAISGTTKSIVSIRARYHVWQKALEQIIGTSIQMPTLPNG
jgi:hypothetical protein